MKSSLFWDVTQPRLVVSYKMFRDNLAVKLSRLQQSKKSNLLLKIYCPETSVTNYQSMLYNSSEDGSIFQKINHRPKSTRQTLCLSGLYILGCIQKTSDTARRGDESYSVDDELLASLSTAPTARPGERRSTVDPVEYLQGGLEGRLPGCKSHTPNRNIRKIFCRYKDIKLFSRN